MDFKKISFRLLEGVQGSFLCYPKIRTLLLKVGGVKIGTGSSIGRGVIFSGNKLNIGSYCFIGTQCLISSHGQIDIEDDVAIAPRVELMTVTHKMGNSKRRADWNEVIIPKRIGRGSWLGQGVQVLPGADIAPGCMIASRSVVTRSTSPNGAYMGLPAKRVGDIDENGTIHYYKNQTKVKEFERA